MNDSVGSCRPEFIAAHKLITLGVTNTDTGAIIRNAQNAQNMLRQTDNLLKFSQKLVRAHEEMSIILCKAPYPRQAMQLTTLFIAINKRALIRDRISKVLEATPGKHLVLVRYDPNRQASWEWVFNGADTDAAKVIWARELGTTRNRQLLEYYSDRKAWLVIADEPVPNVLHEYDR